MTRFTPTFPTINMPNWPSPSASARISRANNLISSLFVRTTAILITPKPFYVGKNEKEPRQPPISPRKCDGIFHLFPKDFCLKRSKCPISSPLSIPPFQNKNNPEDGSEKRGNPPPSKHRGRSDPPRRPTAARPGGPDLRRTSVDLPPTG